MIFLPSLTEWTGQRKEKHGWRSTDKQKQNETVCPKYTAGVSESMSHPVELDIWTGAIILAHFREKMLKNSLNP